MRKISFFLIFLLFINLYSISKPFEAKAKEGTSSVSLRERLEEKLENKRESIKNRITERARNQIRKIFVHLKEQLEKRITRLEKISQKLKNDTEEFAQKGEDVEEIKLHLANADNFLKQSRDVLATLDVELENLLQSQEPKTNFTHLKAMVKEARQNFFKARNELQAAVRLLKRIENKEAVNED